MRIVGADPSLTSFGVCVFDIDSMRYSIYRESVSTITLKPETGSTDGFAIRASLTRQFANLLLPEDLVVFEDFGIVGRESVSAKLVERLKLVGCLELVARGKTGRKFLEIHPSRLRAFTKGNSKPDKQAMTEAVRSKWRIPVRNHDEADAASCALLAYFVYQKSQGGVWDRISVGSFQYILTKKQVTMVNRVVADCAERI